MSVEFYRESPGKFDSRTLSRWTGSIQDLCHRAIEDVHIYIYIYMYICTHISYIYIYTHYVYIYIYIHINRWTGRSSGGDSRVRMLEWRRTPSTDYYHYYHNYYYHYYLVVVVVVVVVVVLIDMFNCMLTSTSPDTRSMFRKFAKLPYSTHLWNGLGAVFDFLAGSEGKRIWVHTVHAHDAWRFAELREHPAAPTMPRLRWGGLGIHPRRARAPESVGIHQRGVQICMNVWMYMYVCIYIYIYIYIHKYIHT